MKTAIASSKYFHYLAKSIDQCAQSGSIRVCKFQNIKQYIIIHRLQLDLSSREFIWLSRCNLVIPCRPKSVTGDKHKLMYKMLSDKIHIISFQYMQLLHVKWLLHKKDTTRMKDQKLIGVGINSKGLRQFRSSVTRTNKSKEELTLSKSVEM